MARPSRLSLQILGTLVLLTIASPCARAQAPAPRADEWIYTVRPGDTLWSIARQHLADARDVARLRRLNGLAETQPLPVGSRLRIPYAWLRMRPRPATIVAVADDVRIERAAQTGSAPAAAGMLVEPGDALTTGAQGSATVRLADESQFSIASNSRVIFDVIGSFASTGMVDTRIRVERGRTESKVGDGPRRGRFRIVTPAAAAVVRGTEFRVRFDAASHAGVTEVTGGTVSVEAGTASVPVAQGTGVIATEGAPLPAPRALLPAPVLTVAPSFDRLPVVFGVEPVPGAESYRVELSSDPAFETLAFEGVFRSAAISVPDLPDGRYAARVRARAADGLEGLDALGHFEIDARPEPPALLEPRAGGLETSPRPVFRWALPPGAVAHRLQVARGDDFASPVIDLHPVTGGTVAADRDLPAGPYRWRVASIDAGGDEGPFSDAQSLTRRDRPALHGLEAPRAETDTIALRWRAGPAGQRYEFQIANDAAFGSLVASGNVSVAEASAPRPQAGTYYLRVRAIDPDGLTGEWAPVQAFVVPALESRRSSRWLWLLVAAPVIVVIALL